MWFDIIKSVKINWQAFKRSLPNGVNLDSLHSRSGGANLNVIFPSEEIMMAWVSQYGQQFNVDWQYGGRIDFHILSIPKIRFDEYDTSRKLRTAIENEEWEFEEYESP